MTEYDIIGFSVVGLFFGFLTFKYLKGKYDSKKLRKNTKPRGPLPDIDGQPPGKKDSDEMPL